MAKPGKRFFKLINNDVVFGDVEVVESSNGQEFLIKEPYTAQKGRIFPYMQDVMVQSPGAIQIHPMNVLWQVPLDEFKEAYEVYTEATSGLITNTNSKILV